MGEVGFPFRPRLDVPMIFDTPLQWLSIGMKDQGLVVVRINPNTPDGLSINELGYAKYGDGFDDMKRYAANRDLPLQGIAGE